MKLVMPTAHRTSQTPSGSMVGLRKMRLEERFNIQIKWCIHLVLDIPGSAGQCGIILDFTLLCVPVKGVF